MFEFLGFFVGFWFGLFFGGFFLMMLLWFGFILEATLLGKEVAAGSRCLCIRNRSSKSTAFC